MKKEIVVMRYLLDEIETFYNENKKYNEVGQKWKDYENENKPLTFSEKRDFFSNNGVDLYRDAPTGSIKSQAMMLRKIAKKLY